MFMCLLGHRALDLRCLCIMLYCIHGLSAGVYRYLHGVYMEAVRGKCVARQMGRPSIHVGVSMFL